MTAGRRIPPPGVLGCLALLAALASCAGGPSFRGVGTRASLVLVDNFEADIDALGYTASGDSDYSAVDFGLHTRLVDDAGDSVAMLGGSVGLVRFREFEATEWSIGGRLYFLETYTLRPYLGLAWVFTDFQDTRVPPFDLSLGNMQSARLALGTEILIVDELWFDVMLDYSYPVTKADFLADLPPPFPSVEGDMEMEGFTLRIGIGIDF